MNSTTVPWPVPPAWRWQRAIELGDVGLGRQRSPINHIGPHMHAYVRAANITWNGWDLSDVKEMNFDKRDFASFQLRSGDVLLNEGSGSAAEIGKTAVWEGAIKECCFQNTLLRFRSSHIDPWYAKAFFDYSARSGHFIKHTQGVNIFHIGKKGLEEFRLPIPPVAEQSRIVAKIDRLSARSKRARDELEQGWSLTERYKDSVLRQAFTGVLTSAWREECCRAPVASVKELDEGRRLAVRHWNERRSRSPRYQSGREATWQPPIHFPASWRWVSVDDISCAIQYGSSAKTDNDPSGVVVLRMGNIQKGKIDRSDVRYLPEAHPEFPDLLLSPGDLLFNRTNSFELVGKTAVFDGGEPTSFASYLIRLRLVGYDPRLLAHYINSSIGRQWIAAVAAQQVGQANVNGTKLAELAVPFMSMQEQQEIVRRIEHAFAAIDRLAAEARSARALLDRLDQAILAKAFRGELVPQDPNDEPASVLLERIRAERALALTPARTRKRRADI